MLTREQKEAEVAELKDKFGRATSVFVADYSGLEVSQMEKLRGGLRKAEASESEFRVSKNTVLRLASEGGPAEGLKEHFTGTTSIAMSFGDPVALAKTLVDYAKDNEQFELRSALLDGQVIDTNEISKLATLPSLDELRGKIVGLLQAPAGKLARLLNEPAGQIARVVAAREAAIGGGGEE
ncbi:MAG: 50S ribosomal protein L10 [Deltaproteobacteria bacterium]|nr:50S ribosomal protein L10 [Deltaproteobacteria bacterium]